MMRKTLLLGTAAALVFSARASAAQFEGWYVSLEGGVNWVEDADVRQTLSLTTVPFTQTANFRNEYDTGWAVLGSLGYGFTKAVRGEFEVGYRKNGIDSVLTTGGATTPSAGGDLSEFTLMANVVYDLLVTDNFSISIGAGAGADRAEFDSGAFNDTDWNFAWQGLVGLNYELGPRTQLFLNYRYFRAVDPDFGHDFAGTTTHVDLHYDDFAKHTVTLGLRYDLWPDREEAYVVPPPPTVPEPMQIARQYIVFFGFNKANLTEDAQRVVAEAAAAAKELGSVRIVVVGHTDRSGSTGYNQALSLKRATVVKDELARQGIAPGDISTSGRGESELLVQTDDGVKEPQNRRASIDLM